MAERGRRAPVAARARPGRDLEMVLAYERDRPDQALTEALLDLRLRPEAAVAAAADRMLRDRAPWALDLDAAAREAIGFAGDERDQRLFRAWCLRTARASQGELARAEGVSAQRIGQITQAAGRRVRDRVAARPGPLRWAAGALRARLGALTGEAAAADLLAEVGASDEAAAGLVLWLAGPFTTVPGRPGWLAVEPRDVVRRTDACLAADGGVRRLQDVRDELADLGVKDTQMEDWLAASGAVVVHDVAVWVARGPLPDVLERLLDARGRPCSVSDLAGDLAAGGRPVEESAVGAALRGRRFSPSPDRRFGLAAWATQPAPAAPRAEPERAARRRNGGGRAAATGIRREPDRQWLAVEVDHDALRGRPAEVPPALLDRLGLRPPLRRTFPSRWGPVSLAHEGQAATRGSVRAVALAAGAGLGDTLLLGFSTDGDLAVEVRAATDGGGRAGGEPAGPAPFSHGTLHFPENI